MNPYAVEPLPEFPRFTLVTRNGVTQSQPGTSVSVTSPAYLGGDFTTTIPGKVRLNVSRHYRDLPNTFGGRGVSKPLDADGLLFDSTEAARAYALARGYLQVYRSVDDHKRRKEMAARYPHVFDRRLKDVP